MELVLDPDLLTSIPPGATRPWPWDQQNPSQISEEVEPPSFQQEASALLTEAPEEMETCPHPREASAQSAVPSGPLKFLDRPPRSSDKQAPSIERVQRSVQQKSSALPRVPSLVSGILQSSRRVQLSLQNPL